jgi:hypothetical protein
MRSRTLCVALAALIAGAVSLASPAGAQSNPPAPQVKKLSREAEARRAAHVTVEKRSFLDAGTEVLPGQRKFTDYAFPPGYSPTAPIDFTTANVRGRLIGPWDPTRNNFWPW